MIVASVVAYKTKESELMRIVNCAINSAIDIIYVVDNSPTDALRKSVEHLSTKVEYIFGQGNVGYGHANNIAIRRGMDCGAKYHLVLNPDIIFERDTIDEMITYMDKREDIGLIAPKLVYTDGSFQATGMMLPSPLVIFGRRLFPKSIVRRINQVYELKQYNLTVPRNVPNICGCFFLIRTSVLNKIGLFDERYFMYFEDFDLVRRIHKVSKTVYYPYVTMIHAHAAEHRTNKKLLIASIRSAIQYFNKWGWIFDADRYRWNRETRTDKSILN